MTQLRPATLPDINDLRKRERPDDVTRQAGVPPRYKRLRRFVRADGRRPQDHLLLTHRQGQRKRVRNHHLVDACNSDCARTAHWNAKPRYRARRNSDASGATPYIREECAARRLTIHLSWNILYSTPADEAQRDGASAENAVALGPPRRRRDVERLKQCSDS